MVTIHALRRSVNYARNILNAPYPTIFLTFQRLVTILLSFETDTSYITFGCSKIFNNTLVFLNECSLDKRQKVHTGI